MAEKSILVLNGPGLAEPGNGDNKLTLQQIEDECAALASQLRISLDFRQTDDENELARWITEDSKDYSALIVNPAAESATVSDDSQAVRSAINEITHFEGPLIEVRLTNIFLDSAVSSGPLRGPNSKMAFICGMGVHGYVLGIRAAEQELHG